VKWRLKGDATSDIVINSDYVTENGSKALVLVDMEPGGGFALQEGDVRGGMAAGGFVSVPLCPPKTPR